DFLTKEMLLDEDQAKIYAAIVKVKDEVENHDDGFGNRSDGDNKMDSALPYYGDYGDIEDDAEEILDGIGNSTTIPIPQKTIKWLGFNRPMSLRADLHALAERHSEYFHNDPDIVLSDIQFVLTSPDNWFIHHGPKIVIFRERKGSGAAPFVRIEIDVTGDTFVVRSVYVGGKNQIAKKMKDRESKLKRLGRSGHSSGSLSVAEYLKALSGRS
ncbi:hypothetical protein, partial [Nitrosomonas sp.]|uniref:hypothetical protein n=1 Tax=Nitrosomonas sp. TaxID=42353 RepID=UPI001D8E4926